MQIGNIANEPLSSVYAAAKGKLGNRTNEILIDGYKHCKPSDEYNALAKHTWVRIYTLNIDDAFDKALSANSPQKVNLTS